MDNQKPPIGLEPRYIHDWNRMRVILAAIDRYADANMPIPKAWVEELKDLIDANFKARGDLKQAERG